MSVWRKAYGPNHKLLGLVMFPDAWAREIDERGSVTFAIPPPVRWVSAEPTTVEDMTYRSGALTRAFEERDAVRLVGVPPEVFETQAGCAFVPGAAYVLAAAAKAAAAAVAPAALPEV